MGKKLLNLQPEDMPSKKVVNWLSMLLTKPLETDSVSTWTKNKTLVGVLSSEPDSSSQEKLLNLQPEDMPSKKVVNWLSMLLTKPLETDLVLTKKNKISNLAVSSNSALASSLDNSKKT